MHNRDNVAEQFTMPPVSQCKSQAAGNIQQ